MLKNIGLAIISIIILLLLGEAFLRIGAYKIVTFNSNAGFHQYDPDLGFIQIPNHEATFKARDFNVLIKSNSHGFRDKEYQLIKGKGIKRVIVLGDSFTWGWGVEQEEIFCEVAEREMENTEFINLGQNAYGTAQELLILKKHGLKFAPDLIVVAFYNNDLYENYGVNKSVRIPYFSLEDGKLKLTHRPQPQSTTEKIKTKLKNHFLLYHLVNHRLALLKMQRKKYVEKQRKKYAERYGISGYFFKDDSEEIINAWSITEALLKEINDLSNKRLLIMYIPTRLQVEDDTYQEALKLSNIDGGEIDLLRPNKLLSRISDRHGISFLDLTQYFREEYKKNVSIYFEHDGHMTKEGHRLAGKKLREKIEADIFVRSY